MRYSLSSEPVKELYAEREGSLREIKKAAISCFRGAYESRKATAEDLLKAAQFAGMLPAMAITAKYAASLCEAKGVKAEYGDLSIAEQIVRDLLKKAALENETRMMFDTAQVAEVISADEETLASKVQCVLDAGFSAYKFRIYNEGYDPGPLNEDCWSYLLTGEYAPRYMARLYARISWAKDAITTSYDNGVYSALTPEETDRVLFFLYDILLSAYLYYGDLSEHVEAVQRRGAASRRYSIELIKDHLQAFFGRHEFPEPDDFGLDSLRWTATEGKLAELIDLSDAYYDAGSPIADKDKAYEITRRYDELIGLSASADSADSLIREVCSEQDNLYDGFGFLGKMNLFD